MRNATQGDVNGLVLDQVMEHWSNGEDVRVFVTDNGKNVESYRYTWTKPPCGPPQEGYGSRDIGTVEPRFDHDLSKDTLAFIIGAVEKYGNDASYSESLVVYLQERLFGKDEIAK